MRLFFEDFKINEMDYQTVVQKLKKKGIILAILAITYFIAVFNFPGYDFEQAEFWVMELLMGWWMLPFIFRWFLVLVGGSCSVCESGDYYAYYSDGSIRRESNVFSWVLGLFILIMGIAILMMLPIFVTPVYLLLLTIQVIMYVVYVIKAKRDGYDY